MTTQRELMTAARRLHKILVTGNLKIVFAESCTGGLVAATLTRIPGISHYLCGSSVVYQLETKTAWLDLPPSMLAKSDAVTSEVAAAMARGVLHLTPHADVAASITGHLGPAAPPQLNGLIYVGLAARNRLHPRRRLKVRVVKVQLSAAVNATRHRSVRIERQRRATLQVLTLVAEFLNQSRDVAGRKKQEGRSQKSGSRTPKP